jgi:hypothetical protein
MVSTLQPVLADSTPMLKLGSDVSLVTTFLRAELKIEPAHGGRCSLKQIASRGQC